MESAGGVEGMQKSSLTDLDSGEEDTVRRTGGQG